jgi:hypothetical protein
MTTLTPEEIEAGIRADFEMRAKAFGPNVYNDFMLAHGKCYRVGPHTYDGERGEQHGCFMNALHTVLWNESLTYCEGKIFIHGVGLDHAWCIDADGVVVDPTVTPVGQVSGYYGMPFKTEYVRRAALINKVYGVLDFFFAGKTAPKLYELGLDAGQQWLLDQPEPKRKRASKKAMAGAVMAFIAAMMMAHVETTHAQTQTFRDANGRETGRAVTNNVGTQFYNAQGQNTGRAVTNNAGTTFYNSSGQITGRSSGRK